MSAGLFGEDSDRDPGRPKPKVFYSNPTNVAEAVVNLERLIYALNKMAGDRTWVRWPVNRFFYAIALDLTKILNVLKSKDS
jgi:hypothetical protein